MIWVGSPASYMSGTVHGPLNAAVAKPLPGRGGAPTVRLEGREPGLRVTRSDVPLRGAVQDLSHRHDLPVIRAVVLEARQAEGVTEVRLPWNQRTVGAHRQGSLWD